jgi:hypothetical protein
MWGYLEVCLVVVVPCDSKELTVIEVNGGAFLAAPQGQGW